MPDKPQCCGNCNACSDCPDLHTPDGLPIEFDQEDDGRWIAECPQRPGCMAYGRTLDEAVNAVSVLLAATPAPINTTRDSKLYMRGFEDGKAFAQARLQSDRDALAAHWGKQ
jgi:hypothetical protein